MNATLERPRSIVGKADNPAAPVAALKSPHGVSSHYWTEERVRVLTSELRPMVRKLARGKIPNIKAEAIADLLSEVIQRTIVNYDPNREGAGKAATLGYKICQNLLRDALKSPGSHIRNLLLGGVGHVASQLGDGTLEADGPSAKPSDDPVEAATRQEKIQLVQAAMGKLSPDQQRAAQLVLLDGSSIRAAAGKLGIGLSTFTRVFEQARASLIGFLSGYRAAS